MPRINILGVDDDAVCLSHLQTTLRALEGDFSVRLFSAPREALEAHFAEPADIVISDLRMEEMNGINLIAEMRRKHPRSIYMLLSGQADLESALAAVNEIDAFRFLIKPTDPASLQLAINSAITEINLQKLREISELSRNTMQKFRLGVIFLNRNLEVIHLNDFASRFLAPAGILELGRDRVLRSTRTNETRDFHHFLKTLTINADESDARSIFRFESRADSRPITASSAFHDATDGAEPYFSLVLSDPSVVRTTPESIAAVLRILPSEARVVHVIAEGGSVEEAAAEAGVSISSARTYLKNVFLKTGVARQGELVRLVMLTAA